MSQPPEVAKPKLELTDAEILCEMRGFIGRGIEVRLLPSKTMYGIELFLLKNGKTWTLRTYGDTLAFAWKCARLSGDVLLIEAARTE